MGLVEEGIVIYVNDTNDKWTMFKCKPEEIEKIHWDSDFISEHALWTTAINSFESSPSFEEFVLLLKEEYDEKKIEKSMYRIKKTYYKAKEYVELSKQVNEVWILAKQKGFDITKDKNQTFRFISQYFKREQMGKVGTIILTQTGFIKPKDNIAKYLKKD